MEKMPIVSFCVSVYKRFFEHNLFGVSAELAYFFLLSLFPLLIVLTNLLHYLPFTINDVFDLVEIYAPGESLDIIKSSVMQIIGQQNTTVLSVSIIITLFFASNGLNAIVRAFNRAYSIREERNYFIVRGISILLTIVLIVLIVFALAIPVFGRTIAHFIFELLGVPEYFYSIWNYLSNIISFIVLFFLFMGIYFFAPSVRLKIREVVIGALFATVGWIVVSLVFSFYVENIANYTMKYGGLSGIVIMLIWFFLTALVILIGGECNAVYHEMKQKNER